MLISRHLGKASFLASHAKAETPLCMDPLTRLMEVAAIALYQGWDCCCCSQSFQFCFLPGHDFVSHDSSVYSLHGTT